jgi:glycosyltransferase involved in cell wall biosynthesis
MLTKKSISKSELSRVLFAHDGPLEVGPDGVPRGVHYTDALLERYLELGTSLTFMMRANNTSAIEVGQYTPLKRQNFRFKSVPNIKGPVKYLRYASEFRKIIKDEVSEHDVIVVRLPSTVGRWTYLEAKRAGKPVLVEFMACTWDALWNYSILGKLSAAYFFLVNRRLLRDASHVIYVTDKFLQQRYPTTGQSISCSNVVVNSGDQDVLNRRLEKIKTKESSTPLILTTIAAVDVPYKGHETVFRAIASMQNIERRFNYRIIGQGDPARLKKLAERYNLHKVIRFVGAVKHSEVARWLDDTDIYIQPSRMEGLPRALIEAMSRGCPALGTGAGGIPELLPPERRFEVGDWKALANLLNHYSQDRLRSDAVRNWHFAEQYTDERLRQRRSSFFATFLADHRIRS